MSNFDLEMQKALEADGEKLFQLTGVDHGPFFEFGVYEPEAPCPCCFESSGYVWQHGHDMSGHWSVQTNIPCAMCNGSGQVPCDEVQYEDERADDYEDAAYERSLDTQATGEHP